MKITQQFLLLMAAFVLSFSASAQWTKQTLPTTVAVPHLGYPGLLKNTIGKNDLFMLSRNVDGNANEVGAVECVRTFDGGRTYKVSHLPINTVDYYYSPQLLDIKTAFVSTTHWETGRTAIYRTIDSGSTWQTLAYHPQAFLDAAIFFDINNGITICDPDSLGTFIAFTTNGGNSFTRLPPSNVPRSQPQEVFLGDAHQVIGDAILQPSLDYETGLFRVWRSTDRGRNWTAGEWMEENSPFGPTVLFTDKNNGLWIEGMITPDAKAFSTADGGATWQTSGKFPGVPSGGTPSYLPNTQNIVAIFEDLPRKMLFSAGTNDFGKTWHSKKDLAPYSIDSIYVQFGLPPFGWTNLDIVDNKTAWAKFSRKELYRYNSTTPLIPEKPDLDLVFKADNDGLPLYGSVKYTLTVTNRGISPATGVKINWLPPYKRTNNGVGSYAYQAAYADKGRYDSWNGVWTLDRIEAGGTATATFHLFVLNNTQNVTQTAQVTACNESDLDSSPNNMGVTPREDDEAVFVAKASSSTAEMPNTAFVGKLADFVVSPNPTKDKINVSITTTNENMWSIRVLSSIGQTVYSRTGQNLRTVEIDSRSFENGLYLVEYQAEGERKVEKIMIQH